MYNFKGKTALITGSTRGIGKDILLELAKKGCNVIVHYLNKQEEANKLLKELKGITNLVSFFKADLRNKNDVALLFQKIKKKYKQLDILVNNVGNYLNKSLYKLQINEWEEIINSNLNATFYCTYYALPLLRKSTNGRIINIGFASSGQIVAKPNILPYQISKTGILLLTKAYALTEAKNKILVNMISPGVMENSIHFPKKEIPLRRIGQISDLSKLVIQTIEHDYITGSHIEFAGGFNL